MYDQKNLHTINFFKGLNSKQWFLIIIYFTNILFNCIVLSNKCILGEHMRKLFFQKHKQVLPPQTFDQDSITVNILPAKI